MGLEAAVAAGLVGSLILYFLFGGADFGGGVWDLVAWGPRREAQRALVEKAIGPIWEANHVWLILAVVIVFTGFPRAFAAVSVAFHVPLTLFLVGIVFRGSSFAFRSFDPGEGKAHAAARAEPTDVRARRRFGLGFSIASVVSPVLLGMVVGGAASGQVQLRAGAVQSGYFGPWLGPFPIATGLFALALSAYLAATYLTNEANEPALAEDFRRGAIVAGVVSAVLGLVTLLLAFPGAPRIAAGLTGRPWAFAVELGALLAGVGALAALLRRRYRWARVLAPAQVALIVGGWAAAQYPYLLCDDLTLADAAAGPRTLRLLLVVLGAGMAVLGPSLWLLFRVFKR